MSRGQEAIASMQTRAGIEKVGQRPKRTIDRLIAKHENAIRRFIGRRSGPQVLRRTSKDDLYQETVKAAIASAETFVFYSDRGFMAWITTIARRVIARAIDPNQTDVHTFRIRRAESSGPGVSDQELAGHCRTPSSHAAARERGHDLREALDKLPEHYRRVITLYKLEERPLSEVASCMGRTKGGTCRLFARAINKLRKELGAR